jgi:hypothetical protein
MTFPIGTVFSYPGSAQQWRILRWTSRPPWASGPEYDGRQWFEWEVVVGNAVGLSGVSYWDDGFIVVARPGDDPNIGAE